jgi:hypothetical protein
MQYNAASTVSLRNSILSQKVLIAVNITVHTCVHSVMIIVMDGLIRMRKPQFIIKRVTEGVAAM